MTGEGHFDATPAKLPNLNPAVNIGAENNQSTVHLDKLGIQLKIPEGTKSSESQRHFLLYIPWDEKYMESIPKQYQQKFLECLPQLAARTSDVHVAVCFRHFDELVSSFKNIDEEVVALSLILHDSGWSKMTEEEVAASLGIKGLQLTPEAIGPKEKHAVIGEQIAREKLSEWGIDKNKTDLICSCVRWHDNPNQAILHGVPALEIHVLADLDHLWSFTEENFWQDVQRKGVAPTDYANNLQHDLDSYFVTKKGKEIARKLLIERKKEISGD